MHYGHANALRQARAFGDILVCGVHSDAEIAKNKGPVVMREEERYAAVAACKWVDVMVPDAPYLTSLEVMDEYACDFCVHGDDITTMADGSDCYAVVKAAGRYRECKRTEGVSTTDLVGRMLLLQGEPPVAAGTASPRGEGENTPSTDLAPSKWTQTLQHFMAHARQPQPGDRIAYVDGAFDLFHVGHSTFLQAVRAQCDFLLVGVHSDAEMRRIKGPGQPLMSLPERVLGVLGCKYADQVVMGAPYSITREFLQAHGITAVYHGGTHCVPDADGRDAYAVPKAMGVFHVQSTSMRDLSTDVIVSRILANRRVYEERNMRKAQKAAAEEAILSASRS
jgi:ethanolamine-phosphate cytidylyltransferase